MKNYRRMLEKIGGYENEFVSVPAGAVREMIDDMEVMLELLRLALPIVEHSEVNVYPESLSVRIKRI